VHDRQTGQTSRVSVASNGSQGNNFSVTAALSEDGRFVAFRSLASNLIGGDTNGTQDIFVHDRQTGLTTRVSGNNGAEPNSASFEPALNADGRFVAFYSFASNLVTGDTNNLQDVFVHDRQTGQTTRVSIAGDGTQANAFSQAAVLSADGRFVTFHANASNLVAGDTNTQVDVFLHDRQTHQTTRLSLATDGIEGNNFSLNLALSADGRFAAISSRASNLVAGDTNGSEDVFVVGTAPPPPVAQDGTLTTAEDTPGSGTLTASTSNGAPVAFSLVTNGALGTAVVTNPATGAYTYTPNANANGIDTFTFKVNNGTGDSNVASITATITPVPDAPVAQNSTATTSEATAVHGVLPVTDDDGDSLHFSIVSSPSFGTVVITDTLTGAFTYTPNAGAFGNDSFQFKASDGVVDSNIGAVTVTVLAAIPGISPVALAFGDQLTGTASAGQVATLSNTGNTSLVIHSIAFTGANPGDFGRTTTCGPSLPAGATCTLAITFAPTATGTRSAALEVSTNSVKTPKSTVAVSGTGTAPIVTLSLPSLNFGNQNVGLTSAAQLITVTNTGTGPLLPAGQSITGVHNTDFNFTPENNTCSVPIAPGGSCSVSVAFTPTNTGTRTASVSLINNAGDSPQSIVLTGTGRPGQLTLTPNPVVFAVQPLTITSSPQTAIVKNTGTSAVSITSISADGDFAVFGTTCGATLNAGASCSVNVTFQPTSGGPRTGLLVVGASSGTVTTVLSGIGTIVDLSPSSLTFGNQTVGSSSAPQAVTLRNMSTSSTLAISNIGIAGNANADYQITTSTCGITLAGGASCTVEVTFNPTKKGNRKASLTVTHYEDGSPHAVSLDGSGK
jgi:hypothetical protein